MSKENLLSKPDNHAEFKGIMVDILEDILTEKGATIENEDRDMAIEDGDDPEELAIIYGYDYDIIADTVGDLIEKGNLGTDKPTMTKDDIANEILESYREICDKAELGEDQEITDKDFAIMRQSIIDTLNEWNVGQ